MNKKKVLILADHQGWIVNRCMKHMIKHMSDEYDFIEKYDQEISLEEFLQIAKVVDVIHFLSWEKLSKFQKTAELFADKIILTVRSHRYNKSWVKDFSYNCKFITAVNPMIAYEIDELTGGTGTQYIPDGIEDELLNSAHVPVVGFVGHIGDREDYKGYDLIKRACEICEFNFYPATGQLTPIEMRDYYESIDVCVCASIAEGFSTVICEAMAMNIPVITTDVGVPSLMNVIKIERDIDSIVNNLNMLFHHKDVESFTWENISNQYKKLYEGI